MNEDSDIKHAADFAVLKPPAELAVSTYFDFTSRRSPFQDFLEGENIFTVLDLLLQLKGYLADKLKTMQGTVESMKKLAPPQNTIVTGNVQVYAQGPVEFFPAVLTGPRKGEGFLFLGKNSSVTGASLNTESGHIAIGEGSVLRPGSVITGPSWIGSRNELRPGSFFRENVITGNDCVFRCEAKHSMFLGNVDFPHPSYVGDSILGYNSHFGNQATTANITLDNATREEKDWKPVVVNIGPLRVDTGLYKLGVVLGDHCQVGCSTVFNPGVFLGRSTWVYPLSLVETGFYPPSVVIKNRPARAGVLKVVPRR